MKKCKVKNNHKINNFQVQQINTHNNKIKIINPKQINKIMIYHQLINREIKKNN